MLTSAKSLAETTISTPVAPKKQIDFSCLTRIEKQEIDTCFQQNKACHVALENTVQPNPKSGFESIALYVLLGFVGGFVLQEQIHR
jgi:hypothetical protein